MANRDPINVWTAHELCRDVELVAPGELRLRPIGQRDYGAKADRRSQLKPS